MVLEHLSALSVIDVVDDLVFDVVVFLILDGESRYRQRRYRVTQRDVRSRTNLSVRFAPGQKDEITQSFR
ncbi:hypothetical protein C6495_08660 [Candidatus Poribacteria bacterium]|nr:MAG: hypothetical protein C6495_08660 [Candidatus Poribacteria bacterium]